MTTSLPRVEPAACETKHFMFQDKYKVDVHIHRPADINQEDLVNTPFDKATTATMPVHAKPTLVFLPAIGVAQRKYSKLFAALTQKGYTIIAADYPCCGDNLPKLDRSVNYNYQDIVNDFIPPLLSFSKHPTTYLFGHSLGGHMATIYSALNGVPMIGVATGNLHYQNWQGLGKLKLLQAVAVFKPLTKLYGYLPGHKIGFGDREARGLIDDWCYNALTGRYDFIDEMGGDESDHTPSRGAGLYFYMEGDDYAPYDSTKTLAKLCAASTLISVKLPKHIKGNPHSIWIKHPELVVDIIDTGIINSLPKLICDARDRSQPPNQPPHEQRRHRDHKHHPSS